MNLFRISLTNGIQEFDYFYISKDGYLGDDKTRKLIIEKINGIKYNTELWKEFKENNPNYKDDFEIISVEQIKDVVSK